MFGKLEVHVLEVVWRFEPITFYIGELRVKLILAPHALLKCNKDKTKISSNCGAIWTSVLGWNTYCASLETNMGGPSVKWGFCKWLGLELMPIYDLIIFVILWSGLKIVVRPVQKQSVLAFLKVACPHWVHIHLQGPRSKMQNICSLWKSCSWHKLPLKTNSSHPSLHSRMRHIQHFNVPCDIFINTMLKTLHKTRNQYEELEYIHVKIAFTISEFVFPFERWTIFID